MPLARMFGTGWGSTRLFHTIHTIHTAFSGQDFALCKHYIMRLVTRHKLCCTIS